MSRDQAPERSGWWLVLTATRLSVCVRQAQFKSVEVPQSSSSSSCSNRVPTRSRRLSNIAPRRGTTVQNGAGNNSSI